MGNLLGKIVLLRNPSERTNQLAVVPYAVTNYDGYDMYECVIVHGNTLSGDRGVGDKMTLSLDFHSSLENQGCQLIDLTLPSSSASPRSSQAPARKSQ